MTVPHGGVVYAPALGGAFLLDDVSNLGGLAKVADLRSGITREDEDERGMAIHEDERLG